MRFCFFIWKWIVTNYKYTRRHKKISTYATLNKIEGYRKHRNTQKMPLYVSLACKRMRIFGIWIWYELSVFFVFSTRSFLICHVRVFFYASLVHLCVLLSSHLLLATIAHLLCLFFPVAQSLFHLVPLSSLSSVL